MKPYFLIACFFLCVSAYSQDLHVYYDAATDSVYYIQNGQTLANPTLKRGKKVFLHVINYNDYLYDLSIQLEEEELNIPSKGLGQMLSLGGNSSALKELMGAAGGVGGDGFSNEKVEWLEDAEAKEVPLGYGQTSSEAYNQAYRELSSLYTTTLGRMEAREAQIVETAKDIQTDLKLFQLNNFMGQEIMTLKYNPQLRPDQIKRLSLEYLEQVLGTDNPAKLDLNSVIEKADVQKNIQKKIDQYQRHISNLNKQLLILEIAKDSLLGFPQLPVADQLSLSESFEETKTRTAAYQDKVAVMESQSETLEDWDLKALMAIRYAYEEIKDHPFTYNYSFTPKADEVKLSITLTPNDSAQVKNIKPKTLAPLELSVYGGIKVNASLGISFGGYFNRPQAYFHRDSIIRADDKDLFQPIITSFIHFYRQSQGSVSFGGSFGLGIALGGESAGLQTYFLGPSLIFGKGQRVVLTTGVMGGKVERLAQGYEVGDAFDNGIIPTRSVYDLGYFLGFSFNLAGK